MAGAFDPLNSLSKAEHDDIDRVQRQLSWRVIAFRTVTIVAFLVLGIKLWDMQIVHSAVYVGQAVENRVRVRTIKALRGVIYDRNGTQLAYNRPSFDIAVDTEDLQPKEEGAVVSRLAKLLNADPRAIKAKIDQQRGENPNLPVTVATGIAWETLLEIKEDHLSLPGVIPVQNTIREYVDGPIFSGVEGYIGPISEGEYPALKKDGYEKDDKVGEAGVELTYEDQLRGTNGLQHVEVDAGGREVQTLDQIDPKSGDSVQLTIDAALQRDVARYLRWGVDRAHCYEADPEKRPFTADCPAAVKAQMAKAAPDGGRGDDGAAIVMDVHTGEILAMVGFPQYDNNVFTGRAADQPKAAAVLTDHHDPLVNRALSASAPGSTFKQITASAALQDRIVTPTSGISVGACWGGGISFCNWDPRSYANMNVLDAIAQSNDIWMATVVAGSGSIRGLGIDRLAWYANQFGLGRQLGIDLPYEQKGLVPTTEWKALNFEQPDQKVWYKADSLFAAIGQGFVSATPLQMVDVAGTIANGGDVMVPHVVRKIIDPNGHVVREIQPRVKNHVPVDAEYLRVVAAGMRRGVYTGSSVLTNLRDLKIAGKTGTAEIEVRGPDGKLIRDKQGHLPTNAWWVGFAPYGNPQIAVGVWIHDAGEGAAFAAPVARKIFARYFHVSDIRAPYGCDTPQTTPGPCANQAAWDAAKVVYKDPVDGEGPADYHDPEFPK